MIMEKIKNLTSDINPIFWKEFSEGLNHELEIQTADDKGYGSIFDLLIFVINKVHDVYNIDCNNYLEILNILSVYSILCREFVLMINTEDIDNAIKSNIISNFIGILSCENVYTNLLLEQNDNAEKKSSTNKEYLINRVKKLYFNLIKFI